MHDNFLYLFTSAAMDLPPLGWFVLIIISELAFGLIVSLTYLYSDKSRATLRSYALTLVILPAVVTIIVMMVVSNLAAAFSLAGAFALIRFRSVASEPKDIAYILFCMAIGLTGGIGLLLYALCVTVLLCAVMFTLERLCFAPPKRAIKTLKITIPENFNYQNAFDDIFERYAGGVALKRVRTTDLGSLFELTFELNMLGGADEKAFIDELRTRNGNLQIALSLGATDPAPVSGDV